MEQVAVGAALLEWVIKQWNCQLNGKPGLKRGNKRTSDLLNE